MGQREWVDPLGLAVAGQAVAELGHKRAAEAADVGQVEQRGQAVLTITEGGIGRLQSVPGRAGQARRQWTTVVCKWQHGRVSKGAGIWRGWGKGMADTGGRAGAAR